MSKPFVHVVVVEIRSVQQSIAAVDCLLVEASLASPPFKAKPQRSIKARETCRVGSPVAETRLQPLGRKIGCHKRPRPSGPLQSNR